MADPKPTWIDIVKQATVEVSSEDELFPITAALGPQPTNGWRAATIGPQVVRILFATPRRLTRLRVDVVDRASERTQEIRVLVGSSTDALVEIARWEFSFSPRGNTEELEEIPLTLDGVAVVELRIDPDVRHADRKEGAYAALRSLWLA